MNRFSRIGMARLMSLIACAAFFLAALRNPTVWYASALVTLQFSSFACALTFAILDCKANKRAVGFCVFGALHWTMNYWLGNFPKHFVFPPFLIEMVLQHWSSLINPRVTDTPAINLSEDWFYTHITYSIGSLIYAFIGARLTGMLYRTASDVREGTP